MLLAHRRHSVPCWHKLRTSVLEYGVRTKQAFSSSESTHCLVRTNCLPYRCTSIDEMSAWQHARLFLSDFQLIDVEVELQVANLLTENTTAGRSLMLNKCLLDVGYGFIESTQRLKPDSRRPLEFFLHRAISISSAARSNMNILPDARLQFTPVVTSLSTD